MAVQRVQRLAPPSSQVSVPVLDQADALRRPEECYFGADFPAGELLSRLYAGIGGVAFLASPSRLGLDTLPLSGVEAFLRALGVGDVPRAKPLPYPASQAFATHVLESVDYPATVRGHLCQTSTDAIRLCRDYSIDRLMVPEHWLQLLERADATTLVSYLLGAGNHFVAADFDPQAQFAARLHAEQKQWTDPSLRIPNAVLHYLRTTPWVPCDDGQKHTPSEVILSATGSRVLQGLYFRPLLRADDAAIQAVGGRKAINGLLTRLGSIASLDAIDPEALYDLLLRLPGQDPDGTHAPGIYRTLIESGVQSEDGPARNRFIQSGKVWSKHDGIEQFLPVQTVRYNANVTIPPVVERYLKLADIPKRKSTKQVQQLFGVDSLSSTDVRIDVVPEGTQYDPSSEDANAHFRDAVPYIYALRLARKLDEDGRERNQLSRARLLLCTRVRVNAMLPGADARSIDLTIRGDAILVRDSLYIVGEFDRAAATLVRFWQGVANLVAELLGTDVAAEAANVLRCRNTSEMEDVVRGLLPDKAEEVLAEARDRFRREDGPDDDREHPVPPPATGESAPGGSEPTTGDAGKPPPAGSGVLPQPEPPKPTSFDPTTGPEKRRKTKRRLVIAPPPSSPSGRVRGPMATENDTFPVVEAYEELANPPRFPIRVSHIRGTHAFGCDLLSLRTEDARVRAKEEGVVVDADILRFIEVKGSSSRTGAVELTDNEYDKARAECDRYFIYRVFRDPLTKTIRAAILQDPVHSKAIRNIPRFDLAQGSGAEWFTVNNEAEEEGSDDPTGSA